MATLKKVPFTTINSTIPIEIIFPYKNPITFSQVYNTQYISETEIGRKSLIQIRFGFGFWYAYQQ
jgi:hypothetical protein